MAILLKTKLQFFNMKIKCYSVRLKSLISISDKAYKATAFDGSEDIIPKSQVLAIDYDSQKSDAYYISEWILERKNIQFSRKKERVFDTISRKIEHNIVTIVETMSPEKIEPIKTSPDESLIR